MTPFYRCSVDHDEVRWAFPAGEFCWVCGRAGRPAAGYVITSIDAFIRDLDDVVGPVTT